MATIGELTDSLISQGIPIEGISSSGSPHVIAGQTLTQQQSDIIASEFAIWNAQTPTQKLQSTQFLDAKALVLDINQALQAIDLISTVNLSVNPFVVYDTDGTTPLLTIPNDADWTAFTNAQVKVAVRTLSILFALTLQADIAQKAGYLDIMKYIKSELNNP